MRFDARPRERIARLLGLFPGALVILAIAGTLGVADASTARAAASASAKPLTLPIGSADDRAQIIRPAGRRLVELDQEIDRRVVTEAGAPLLWGVAWQEARRSRHAAPERRWRLTTYATMCQAGACDAATPVAHFWARRAYPGYVEREVPRQVGDALEVMLSGDEMVVRWSSGREYEADRWALVARGRGVLSRGTATAREWFDGISRSDALDGGDFLRTRSGRALLVWSAARYHQGLLAEITGDGPLLETQFAKSAYSVGLAELGDDLALAWVDAYNGGKYNAPAPGDATTELSIAPSKVPLGLADRQFWVAVDASTQIPQLVGPPEGPLLLLWRRYADPGGADTNAQMGAWLAPGAAYDPSAAAILAPWEDPHARWWSGFVRRPDGSVAQCNTDLVAPLLGGPITIGPAVQSC